MFCVLGRVAVVVDGRERVLGNTREAALLADLLVHANQVVTAERLIDDVWRGVPPPGAAATLQTYVKNLRKLLVPDGASGPARSPVETQRPGYRLVVGAQDLDAWRSEQLITAGRRALADGDAMTAATRLREGLALWMGPAYANLAGESFAQAEAVRLEELRLGAMEDRNHRISHSGATASSAASSRRSSPTIRIGSDSGSTRGRAVPRRQAGRSPAGVSAGPALLGDEPRYRTG